MNYNWIRKTAWIHIVGCFGVFLPLGKPFWTESGDVNFLIPFASCCWEADESVRLKERLSP